jgi:DtxR family Mn-dependent transcriptional regulator
MTTGGSGTVHPEKTRPQVLLDEVLSVLYEKWERHEPVTPDELLRVRHGEHVFTPQVLDAAERAGLVERRDGRVELTPEGLRKAQTVIRCDRLAERLFVDVLRLRDDLVEPSACRLEHHLSAEVADSICTLLGHPKTCPHGHAIPPGECCRHAETEVQPIIKPLSSLEPGEAGTVAYVSSSSRGRLTRLGSLGLIPGQTIQVKQVRPSYIVAYGEMELALEKGVADDIYVRLTRNRQRP